MMNDKFINKKQEVASVDRELLRELMKMLKEERVISETIVIPFKDEFGYGVQFVNPDGTSLRLRKVSPSLSDVELSSGIFYMGGIQIAVILPGDDEVFHTFNLPLQYANFMVNLIEDWTYELRSAAEDIATDYKNAHIIAGARIGLQRAKEVEKQVKQTIDDRDVI